MKILFVYSVERGCSLEKPLGSFAAIQFGISYISSVLTRAGNSTSLLVLSSELEEASLALARKTIEEFGPQVIGFTSVATQYSFVERVATITKRAWPGIFLIVGGPHVSLNPDEAARSVFDAVCIGEGEFATLELVEQLQQGRPPDGIRNLWLKRAGEPIQKNPTRPFLQDLDALPFPDRGMWQPWVDNNDSQSPAILLGRGCPYLCTYCCNHALRKLAEGKYVRVRSPENIVEEIKLVRNQFPKEDLCIGLEIETIGVNKEWTLQLCAALQRLNATLPQPIRFQINFRITAKSLDAEIFRALAGAHFCRLNIGLEAGSERVRRDVLRRNYTNAEFLRATQLAREHGLDFNVFNMVGIPGETPKDHMETVRLNRETRPNMSYTSIFFPYPGTELHRVCKERGLLDSPVDVRRERKKAALDLPEFPRRKIQRAYNLFEWRIHKGHWPLHVRLRKWIGARVFRFKTLNRLFLAIFPVWQRLGKAGLVNRSYGRDT